MHLALGLLLAWTYMVSPSPVPLNVSIPAANLTYGPIPTQLEIVQDFSLPIPFDEDAAFINVVEALRYLAQDDYKGFTPLWKFRTEKYPLPVISLTPDSSGVYLNFTREIAIWGLILAYNFLYAGHHGAPAATHFTFLWYGRAVGGCYFGEPERSTQELGGHSNDASASKISTDLITRMDRVMTKLDTTNGVLAQRQDTVLTNSSNGHQLTVDFRYFGDSIEKNHMIRSIMWLLGQAARPPADAEIKHRWAPAYQEEKCYFAVQAPVHPSPPFLHFFWLIDAVALAGTWVVDHNTYQGLRMEIRVDGTVIGKAAFVGPHPYI